MRRFFAALAWLVVVLWLAIIFVPKKELYYLAERALAPIGVVYSDESVSDLGLLFSLKGGTLYYDKMAAVEPAGVHALMTLFYNRVWLEPMVLGSEAAALFPAEIEHLEAWHTLFWPHQIFLKGQGGFGRFEGQVDLVQRSITLTIQSPAEIQDRYRQLFRGMKSTEEGYRYERVF